MEENVTMVLRDSKTGSAELPGRPDSRKSKFSVKLESKAELDTVQYTKMLEKKGSRMTALNYLLQVPKLKKRHLLQS